MSKSGSAHRRSPTLLRLEPLESRLVPAANVFSGFVYVDIDNDGVKDVGEIGIAGSVIELRDHTTNIPLQQATTGADGSYAFAPVADGDYCLVQVVQPAGYLDGKEAVGLPHQVGQTANDEICVHEVNCSIPDINFGERVSPPPTQTTGSEGLTPGFWKENAAKHDGSAWLTTGYYQYQTVASVFGNSFGSALGGRTLYQALGTGGGGINALLRHSVAAVLNAGHPGIDYPWTTQQIVDAVNLAIASGPSAITALATKLDSYNNFGAGVDQHGRY